MSRYYLHSLRKPTIPAYYNCGNLIIQSCYDDLVTTPLMVLILSKSVYLLIDPETQVNFNYV
jgi:hypothetical protein